jgi:hypothetical protein
MTIYSNWSSDRSNNNIISLTPDVVLTSNDIVIWFDVMYEEDVTNMIKRNGFPGRLISTAHSEKFVDFCQVDHWPCFLLKTSLDMFPRSGLYDHLPVEYCANFLINKKQINRYLLLKLVEWFQLSSYDYTWSGLGASMDLGRILNDFDQLPQDLVPDLSKFKNHILGAVEQITTRFISAPGAVSNGYNIANYGSNVWTWDMFLGEMISKSAVSLISDSVRYEKYMVYTEKTIYAIHGLTFPLWIGGYRQAETWATKGFDVFDDVVNHDYQYCDTLLERCTRAFKDNLKILTDLDFAREQKLQHLERLRKNRDLLVPVFQQQDLDFWNQASAELHQARPFALELVSLKIR